MTTQKVQFDFVQMRQAIFACLKENRNLQLGLSICSASDDGQDYYEIIPGTHHIYWDKYIYSYNANREEYFQWGVKERQANRELKSYRSSTEASEEIWVTIQEAIEKGLDLELIALFSVSDEVLRGTLLSSRKDEEILESSWINYSSALLPLPTYVFPSPAPFSLSPRSKQEGGEILHNLILINPDLKVMREGLSSPTKEKYLWDISLSHPACPQEIKALNALTNVLR
jgi:hypothetical protein